MDEVEHLILQSGSVDSKSGEIGNDNIIRQERCCDMPRLDHFGFVGFFPDLVSATHELVDDRNGFAADHEHTVGCVQVLDPEATLQVEELDGITTGQRSRRGESPSQHVERICCGRLLVCDTEERSEENDWGKVTIVRIGNHDRPLDRLTMPWTQLPFWIVQKRKEIARRRLSTKQPLQPGRQSAIGFQHERPQFGRDGTFHLAELAGTSDVQLDTRTQGKKARAGSRVDSDPQVAEHYPARAKDRLDLTLQHHPSFDGLWNHTNDERTILHATVVLDDRYCRFIRRRPGRSLIGPELTRGELLQECVVDG